MLFTIGNLLYAEREYRTLENLSTGSEFEYRVVADTETKRMVEEERKYDHENRS